MAEQSSINASISTLENRLNLYFDTGAVRHNFRFGSSTRGTILPRWMDEASDIDYMIVFSDDGRAPQTYLSRLRAFVQAYYPKSTIYQANPTIVLELDHIKFDLVPATTGLFGGLRIPDSNGGWMGTDPNKFNATLEKQNKVNKSLIKPTIRLMKYWNAGSGFPFESFKMEKWICDLSFSRCANLKDYLFAVVDSLSTSIWQSQRVNDEIRQVKNAVFKVRQYERAGQPAQAEVEARKLFQS